MKNLCIFAADIQTKNAMNEKIKKLMSDKCKDFGLTDKAIEDLAKIASEGIDENASDEDVEKKVDSLVPLAKAMQAEITRKTQKTKPTPKPKDEGKGGEEEEDENVPNWAKSIQKEISELRKENESLKKQDEAKARQASIAAKAKELGIPEFMMKRVTIADDADIEQELTSFKQELVNAKLMPAESAGERGSSDDQNRKEAEDWAASLPNK